MKWDAKRLFQILPFYTTFIEKLPFYDELSIVKNLSAFSRYAGSYKVENVDKKVLRS